MSFASSRRHFQSASRLCVKNIVPCGLYLLAGASGFWAFDTFTSSVTATELGAYASRIAAGELFKKDVLQELRPKLDQVETSSAPRADIIRSAALIELRLAEINLFEGTTVSTDPQYGRTERSLKLALRHNPTDAFLWYAMFWLDKTRTGFQPKCLDYLRMSYHTGPHEGWVAVHRNRDAVTIFSLLPPDLQGTVKSEFNNLVAANYMDDAADILTGPGWPQRESLLAAIAKLPEEQRRTFARRLSNRGVDVIVPGISNKSKHPWDFAPG